MKVNKKTIVKISIITLVLMALYALMNKSYGFLLGALGVIGLGTIFVYAVQVLAVAIGLLGQGIISSLTAIAGGSGTAVSGLKSIFFNQNSLTTASYFATKSNTLGLPDAAIWDENNVMFAISSKITQYYTVMRNLAVAILLFVLLYIAIRMAISTIASEEAKYKKMLKDWTVSLALVYVLHFIMIITFFISNKLVALLYDNVEGTTLDYARLIGDGLIPITGMGDAIIFLMLIGMELTFLFMYIKRVIVLGFLILIAPLITITYSIDKVGDGKSQALNNWLKEFIYNVIIQPFHCILYLTLIDTVIKNMAGYDTGSFIIYIIVLQFVKEAEEILKRIFNIQAQSMPGMKNMGAMALGAMSAFGGLAKGSAKTSNKKMPNMTKEAGSEGLAAAGAPQSRQIVGGNNNAANAAVAAATGGITPPTPPPAISGPSGGGTPPPLPGGSGGSSGGGTPPPPGGSGGGSGGGTPPPPGGSGGSSGGGTPPPPPGGSGGATSSNSKFGEFKNAFTGTAKLLGGADTTVGTRGQTKAGKLIKGYIGEPLHSGHMLKNAAKAASVAAFAGIGLGMGDSKSALGLGMTAFGISNTIDGAITDSRNMQQLEKNEEAYNTQYQEYVDQMKALHPDMSEDKIRADLVGMFELYDDDLIDWDNMEITQQEKDLKRKFLGGAYSQLRESYEITGGEKPTDLVKSHTTKKASSMYRNVHPNG